MCYDIKASLNAQLKRARHYGDEKAVREIEEKLAPLTDLPLFHTTGFQHPKLFIYTERTPILPEVAVWGLIPHWVKDGRQREKFWNNTLNARGETIFEKPAFRDAARHHRCLIPVDGFYEHHHYRGNSYPYFIRNKNREPLVLAGLSNEWIDPDTGEVWNSFSIVTTSANPLMARIHNNPKIQGPRMPVILPPGIENNWLARIDDPVDIHAVEEMIQPYPENELEAYTVGRLRGKEYKGNVKEITEEVSYPELAG